MTSRAYYADLIEHFPARSSDEILGNLARNSGFSIEASQRDAWLEQINLLRGPLEPYQGRGKVYFEYAVPRLGKRIDVVVLIDHVVFIIEFKVGEKDFTASATDQVWDYALDLKNFHETTHDKPIAPVLVATRAKDAVYSISTTQDYDLVLLPIHAAPSQLGGIFEQTLLFCDGPKIDPLQWDLGRYHPTPTIVEAAVALYSGHDVSEISRSDAGAINLSQTSETVAEIIRSSRELSRKSICFVTGVPGAGKTLVGLNIATKHIDKDSELYSVFLSGNGPLVDILREALARDEVRRIKAAGGKLKKGEALSRVKAFIQNVHHFRDDCLVNLASPPIEHVAIFDEAQRAWNLEQTAAFMLRKKQRPDFKQSEPEFLMSCLDRHSDWAVVVCLVGGGQEINTGEAGIAEWVASLNRSFREWHVHISPELNDEEYGAGHAVSDVANRANVHFEKHLHLGVSMRSFRAEHVSTLVKQILDLEADVARQTLRKVESKYPIVITRSLSRAKAWMRGRARGSERYGMVVSSQAQRLKPHAIDVRSPMDPIHWFLDGKEDIRSSYYLEDVATEFHVQGLELDWSCVVWDADFRFAPEGWQHYSFVGSRWNCIRKSDRQTYLKNAYRVLLTRARQGMVLVIPEGDLSDATRSSTYYDPTFDYLERIGFQVI
ncbi:MAG TPA: DUF2075 domain-containing protein [Polaromonas sp.]|uniref:DUF2075 domain-containing protein n=1 Tax=Polaromonas sp. TaxID=1869339 RepID=UPI002D272FC4|nr:DUF2075 domain-containing protein [Polaromonas sp.]HYW55515.1 DUF2075 domain-containing protein [Polaromonas sp.]